MTLKEVKKHFKNAKEVKTHYGNSITYTEAVKGHTLNTFMDKVVSVTLWDNKNGFAEIISHKEPKQKLNKLTVKEIVHAFENPQWLKDTFPKAFEVELEVGKWYKSPKYGKALFCLCEVKYLRIDAYGFDYKGKWHNLEDFGKLNNERELATHQEIETALKNEFEKQSGVKFEYYFYKNNTLDGWNTRKEVFELFKDGVFAKFKTKEEAEKLLNCKIV